MPTVKVPRLYTGDDGWSHWDEVDVDLSNINPNGVSASADIVPTKGVIWRRMGSSDTPGEYHTAPAKQYVVVLTGSSEYGTHDGEVRAFGPGGIFIVEDVTGHGHTARGTSAEPRVSLHIPFADQTGTHPGGTPRA